MGRAVCACMRHTYLYYCMHYRATDVWIDVPNDTLDVAICLCYIMYIPYVYIYVYSVKLMVVDVR